MIEALALTLATLASAPALAPAVEEDIVVIGKQLRDWRGVWKVRKQRLNQATQPIAPCLTQTRKAAIERLAEARAAS